MELFFSFTISNMSALDFKLAKLTLLAKDNASIPVVFFKSLFVA